MTTAIRAKIRKKRDESQREGFWPTVRKLLRDRVYSHRQNVFLERDLALSHREYNRKRNWEIRRLDGKQDNDRFRHHFSDRTSYFTSLFEEGAIALARSSTMS